MCAFEGHVSTYSNAYLYIYIHICVFTSRIGLYIYKWTYACLSRAFEGGALEKLLALHAGNVKGGGAGDVCVCVCVCVCVSVCAHI